MNFWQTVRKDISISHEFFLQFAKNPVRAIAEIPLWHWPTLIAIHTAVAMTSGLLSGIVSGSLFQLAFGLILLPLTSLIALGVATAFFYYSFIFFFEETVAPKPLVALLVIANIPFALFHTLSPLIPPIDLIGLGFTSLLLIVGFVDTFQLPKKSIVKLVVAVYALFVLVWVGSTISRSLDGHSYKPQTLDAIEKDIREAP